MSPDTDPGSIPTPLIIIGSPRSGTTFLSRMVNHFFDVHVCRDNGTLVRTYRYLSHYEPLSDDENARRLIKHLYADRYFRERLIDRGLKLTQEEVLSRVPERKYSALIATIFGSIAAERGKRMWGYKRASLARMTGNHVNDLFPTAKFVHIIRDAREVALSMHLTRTAALERNWHFGAVDWVSHVSAGRSIGAQIEPGRYFELRYDRLMAEPAAILSELLDYSGGGPDRDARVARIHAEIPQLVKVGNTEKWRTLAPADGIRQVERVAGPLLHELGYALVNPGIAGASIGAVELAWLHANRLVSNLFQTRLGVTGRYRLEVLKEHWRARARD